MAQACSVIARDTNQGLEGYSLASRVVGSVCLFEVAQDHQRLDLCLCQCRSPSPLVYLPRHHHAAAYNGGFSRPIVSDRTSCFYSALLHPAISLSPRCCHQTTSLPSTPDIPSPRNPSNCQLPTRTPHCRLNRCQGHQIRHQLRVSLHLSINPRKTRF